MIRPMTHNNILHRDSYLLSNATHSEKDKFTLNELISNLKIPIKKVAIELNKEIVDKKRIGKFKLKNNDVIEIVHFIGGG